MSASHASAGLCFCHTNPKRQRGTSLALRVSDTFATSGCGGKFGRGDERPLNASGGYAELHCKTNFSFLEGASHPDELVHRAKELGYAALAVTDRNSLAGVVRAHAAAKTAGLKLLIGAEITLDDASPVLLYAPDKNAYRRLARLITRGRRAAVKGDCCLHFQDVAEHADGLLAAVLMDNTTPAEGLQELLRYRSVFADRCYLAAGLHHGVDDERLLEQYLWLTQKARIRMIATNCVLYHEASRRPLQDVLTAIRHATTVAELG